MDLNSPEMQKVLEKVEKLLRLASNNPNEAEASAAATKAQDILAAFNLDMSSLEQAGGDKGKREDSKSTGGLYKWQRDLWDAVSKLNFTMYWSLKGLKKGQKYEHRLVGRTVNILSTRLMAEYLEQAVERLTRDHYDNQPSVYFSKAGVAFREGMAQRIVERLRDRRWEQEREAKAQAEANKARASHPAYAGPTGNALTIVDVKRSEAEANQEFVYDLQYGTGAWAKAKAQRVALHAEWDRQAEEARLAQEAFKRDHPAEWAAEQARKQKEADAWAKREERNSRRRTGGRYYAPKGPRHADYYTGHAKGGDVSLDRQVSSRDDRKLS